MFKVLGCFANIFLPSQPQSLPDPAGTCRKGVGLSVLTWGQLLPTVLYCPVLTQPLRPPDPSAGPCQSCTAPALKLISPFPLLIFFFSQALSGCMEQQGPMQIPGTPPSPLIHCELPKGPPQALLHIGTPSHPLPLWSRTVCLRLCHLWVPFKKVGGNPPNADDCSGHA